MLLNHKITYNTQGSAALWIVPVVVVVLVLGIAGWLHATAPSRHDSVTQNDLNAIRMDIGRYVVANKKMPTIDQLSLPADIQARAAQRHYTLSLVADNSKKKGLFQQPTFDYKQCADFLTNTSDLPGDTNDTHHDFHLHHQGTHCFLNYAILNDARVKP